MEALRRWTIVDQINGLCFGIEMLGKFQTSVLERRDIFDDRWSSLCRWTSVFNGDEIGAGCMRDAEAVKYVKCLLHVLPYAA